MFYLKKLFLKTLYIHSKTAVLESLFNSEYCKIFKNTYSEKYMRRAASENAFMFQNLKIVHKGF